jgi:hypothetical protein
LELVDALEMREVGIGVLAVLVRVRRLRCDGLRWVGGVGAWGEDAVGAVEVDSGAMGSCGGK